MDKKTFIAVKACVFLAVVVACGLYYVLFVDDNVNEGKINKKYLSESSRVNNEVYINKNEEETIMQLESEEKVIDVFEDDLQNEVSNIEKDVENSVNAINEDSDIEINSIEEKNDSIDDVDTYQQINNDIDNNLQMKISEEKSESKIEIIEDDEYEDKININKASQEELQTLKNIGPVVAKNIIEYRDENGRFEDIEDIKNVKGIGKAKYASIKDYIYVR